MPGTTPEPQRRRRARRDAHPPYSMAIRQPGTRPAGSFAAFIGHPAYNTGTLCADMHRFAFLLGASDGDDLFGEPAP
jgi:hypothetical protein